MKGYPLINLQLAELAEGFSKTADGARNLDKAQELLIRGQFQLGINQAVREVESAQTVLEQLQQQADRNRERQIAEAQSRRDILTNNRGNILGDSGINEETRKIQLGIVQTEIDRNEAQIKTLEGSKAIVDAAVKNNAELNVSLATQKLNNLQLQQALALIKQQADKYENLVAFRDRLAKGDADTLQVLKEQFDKNAVKEQIQQYPVSMRSFYGSISGFSSVIFSQPSVRISS